EGIGSVMTNSPSWSTTGVPAASYAATWAPRHGPEISPRHTGNSGAPPTKPVHTSVPPESDCTGTVAPTASYTQSKPSAGSGAPVEPSPRSGDRSTSSRGTNPLLRHASRNGAEVPKYVTPARAANSHNVLRLGCPGSPSNSTTAAPTVGPETR